MYTQIQQSFLIVNSILRNDSVSVSPPTDQLTTEEIKTAEEWKILLTTEMKKWNIKGKRNLALF